MNNSNRIAEPGRDRSRIPITGGDPTIGSTNQPKVLCFQSPQRERHLKKVSPYKKSRGRRKRLPSKSMSTGNFLIKLKLNLPESSPSVSTQWVFYENKNPKTAESEHFTVFLTSHFNPQYYFKILLSIFSPVLPEGQRMVWSS